MDRPRPGMPSPLSRSEVTGRMTEEAMRRFIQGPPWIAASPNENGFAFLKPMNNLFYCFIYENNTAFKMGRLNQFEIAFRSLRKRNRVHPRPLNGIFELKDPSFQFD